MSSVRKPKPLDEVKTLFLRALAGGAARASMTRAHWFMAGNCLNPFTVEVYGKPSVDGEKWVTVTRSSEVPLTVELVTRCHKCAPCLAARARMWSHRARAETRAAHRTWFGTLTLRPDALFIQRSRAAQAWGSGFEELPEDQQFARLHNEIGKELTKMMKRIRTNSGVLGLRALIVCEAHKSGNPHYHILIHEPSPEAPIRWKLLDDAWSLGFTKWRLLADHRDAGYLCKYLSKDARARVRASRGYGRNLPTPLEIVVDSKHSEA